MPTDSRALIHAPGVVPTSRYVGPQTHSQGYAGYDIAPHSYVTRFQQTSPAGFQTVFLNGALSICRTLAATTPGRVEASLQETGNYWLMALKGHLDAVGQPVNMASPYHHIMKTGGGQPDLWGVTADFSAGGTLDYMLSQLFAQVPV